MLLYNASINPQCNSIQPYKQYVYKTVGNTCLPLNLYLPSKSESNPFSSNYLFVMIHGGAWQAIQPSNLSWNGSLLDYQAKYYSSLGFLTASISYRSIDFFEDTTIADLIKDCQDALEFLKELFPSAHFLLLGDSAGAHLALSLALQNNPDIDAVIAANPVTDLTTGRWNFTAPCESIRYRFSPLYHTNFVSSKFLCMHGDADQVVDYHLTQSFCEKMNSAGNVCDFILLPGVPHAFLLMGYRSTKEQVDSYMQIINIWLKNNIFLELS